MKTTIATIKHKDMTLEVIQYSTHYMLRVTRQGTVIPEVHTSKDKTYLDKLLAEYLNGTRVGCGAQGAHR